MGGYGHFLLSLWWVLDVKEREGEGNWVVGSDVNLFRCFAGALNVETGVLRSHTDLFA